MSEFDESKGFSNKLFIMLNDDRNASTPVKEDNIRLSIESTPLTTPKAGEKRATVSNFLSRDLMKKLEESSPVKPFEDDDSSKKPSLFTPKDISQITYTSFLSKNKFSLKKSDYSNFSHNSTPSDIEAEEKVTMFGKNGWFCIFCKNFNYESNIF
jgi:hypothetical protein